MQELQLTAPELSLIEESKAEQIKKTFEPMVEMVKGFENDYNAVIGEAANEITADTTGRARKLRLEIAKVRTQTEAMRKEEKEKYLRAGKAIDGVSNIVKWATKDMEDKLKEVENHFALKEQARLEKLQEERAAQLAPYVEDANERNLASLEEDVWVVYLANKKKEHEDRVKAEKQAEEERIAKEKEEARKRELERKELERLKKEKELAEIEAKKKEAEMQKKLARMEKEKKAAEEKAKEEERKRKEEEQKAAAAEKERQAKELEAEMKKAQELEAEKQKDDAGHKATLINEIGELKDKYKGVFTSVENKAKYEGFCKLMDKVVNYLNE